MTSIKKKTAKLACKKGYSVPSERAIYRVLTTGTECVWNCRSIGNGGSTHELVGYLPTQSELQTWLRDEHEIDLFMDLWGENGEFYHIEDITKGFGKDRHQIGTGGKGSKKYEKALEQGLQKALKLIETND